MDIEIEVIDKSPWDSRTSLMGFHVFVVFLITYHLSLPPHPYI